MYDLIPAPIAVYTVYILVFLNYLTTLQEVTVFPPSVVPISLLVLLFVDDEHRSSDRAYQVSLARELETKMIVTTRNAFFDLDRHILLGKKFCNVYNLL